MPSEPIAIDRPNCYHLCMTLFHSIVLGIVQGLAELLPISSSAHLWAIPYFFGWPYQGLAFDTALHMGTVLAILTYFWSDWTEIFRSTFSKKTSNTYPNGFLWQILVATIPAGIAGVLLDKVESRLETPVIIAITMAVFGFALWAVDRFSKKSEPGKKMGWIQSFIVGTAQCLALVPGVSRSGVTMLTSRALGYDREQSARFSFLIGTPATVGAFLFEARKLSSADLNLTFFAGVFFAAIFGFLAIKYLLNYLKRSDFSIFAIYRLIFAIVLLSVYFSR